jgi:hypothetical protein
LEEKPEANDQAPFGTDGHVDVFFHCEIQFPMNQRIKDSDCALTTDSGTIGTGE